MQLTPGEFFYFAFCLEGFFFGFYSGIFALHFQIHASREEANSRKQNIMFHALWVLYVLSAASIALDIAFYVINAFKDDISTTYHLLIARPVVFGFCDFIAQSILIYRCWIVWSRNSRVVIIPSILAFGYLVMWIANTGAAFTEQDNQDVVISTGWGNILVLTSLAASMTVNALVTGLIVFKIFKVFHKVKSATTSDEISSGVTGGRKLQSLVFIIIESGMALFSIQLIRFVIVSNEFKTATTAEIDIYELIIGIHGMLNGITPTIILVRVSMGLSFHDEPSLVEAVTSLHFVADNPNAIPGVGSIRRDGSLHVEPDDSNAHLEMVNISQDGRDNGGGSDKIQTVDRRATSSIGLKDSRLCH